MSNVVSVRAGGQECFPAAVKTNPVTDELNRIFNLLRDALPADASVSFEFDGKLQVHIDVRKREEVILIEELLPRLEGGLFHGITRSATPHRPFFHRISAVVDS